VFEARDIPKSPGELPGIPQSPEPPLVDAPAPSKEIPQMPKVTVQCPDHPDPFAGIEERLDRITRKLDEVLELKFPKKEDGTLYGRTFPSEASSGRAKSGYVSESSGRAKSGYVSESSGRNTRTVFDPPRSKKSTAFDSRCARGKLPQMIDNWSLSEGDDEEKEGAERSPRDEEDVNGDATRRAVHQVRAVDLKLAWQLHAKECHQELGETDAIRPVLRLLYRSRADQVWELLDDQNSSTAAWCVSQFMKLLVISSVLVTNFQTTEERTMDPTTATVLEYIFDTIFLIEFLSRLFAAPSKRGYISDWLNWADVISAFGLPIRIAFLSGSDFLTSQVRQTSDWNLGEVTLLFILPLIRLMKLLRYFDSFHLLIDACYNSAESLPLLTYVMTLITFWSATGIYLVESRSNIPSMQHSLWLSLVTMTTVGYGDYYPKSIAGYIFVSVLTIVSVLFLALPVGIIGYEFTACWQQRTRVLLLTRARKCLAKWGYTASDVKVLFEFMDIDGDGNLNLNEFIELFHQMRIGITMVSAVDLFQMFDDDQSGTIEYDEFLRHIFPEEYVKGTQRGMSVQLSRSRVVEALQHLEEIRTNPA